MVLPLSISLSKFLIQFKINISKRKAFMKSKYHVDPGSVHIRTADMPKSTQSIIASENTFDCLES